MIYDFLFPKYCLECKKTGKYICDECYNRVTPCGRTGNDFSVFKYEGVIRKAITSLKYKFAFDIADELVGRLVNLLISKTDYLDKKFVLIPIPLYKSRQNWRGFNQSELIGEKLAKLMGWKFIPDLLSRTKNTKPQVGLNEDIRHKNLSGVFSVSSNHFISNNCSLVLFDDVYTTGSTINEAKKVLLEAGFKNIYSLTIARQELIY